MVKILVVDDSVRSTELISNYLVQAGYEVITANDGQMALKKARLYKPALIILDLSLPKVSGYDLCKALKKDEEIGYILILAMSTLYSKETRARAFQVGADEYIEKSFDRESLLAKVQSLLRLKQLNDELNDHYEKIDAQNKQIEIQLQMARRVQRALIQDVDFKAGNVRFMTKYLPAMGVGGDVFDVIHASDHEVCLFMADVSGHGISAALLTSMLKMLFRSSVLQHTEPDKLLFAMNNEFCSIFQNSDAGVYATAFCAVFDQEEHRITFANAGHTLPLFADFHTGEVAEMSASGVPLGLLENNYYLKKYIAYQPGDLLLFQTDGLCDSLYKSEPEEFILRVREMLASLVADKAENRLGTEEMMTMIMDAFVDDSREGNYECDDISIILVDIEPQAGEQVDG